MDRDTMIDRLVDNWMDNISTCDLDNLIRLWIRDGRQGYAEQTNEELADLIEQYELGTETPAYVEDQGPAA